MTNHKYTYRSYSKWQIKCLIFCSNNRILNIAHQQLNFLRRKLEKVNLVSADYNFNYCSSIKPLNVSSSPRKYGKNTTVFDSQLKIYSA